MKGISGKLANKFLGLGLAAAIAVVVPVVPLVTDYNARIDAAEKERAGVAVHRELRAVLQELQRHRGASTSQLSGKDGFKERADQSRAGVDGAIQKVDAALEANEARLGKLARWGQFKARWQDLKSKFTALAPADNVKEHNVVIDGLLGIMGEVADASGLVVDPDLAGSYAMDMVVMQLPHATERMGQSRALGSVILSERSLSQERRDAMIGAFAEIRLREKDILADGNRLSAANPALRDRLAGAFDQARAGIAQFISNVDQNILKAESLSYEATRYFDETTRAIDASFKLYDDGVGALDDMLAARTRSLQGSRLAVLLAAAGLVGAAAIVAFVILRRVNRSIVGAADALDRIAGGRFDVPLKAESNDEIGYLIGRLDDMQNQLRERLERERRAADETRRIKVALDVSSNSVMVADPAGKIIYCNGAVLEMMRAAEADIRKQLPNFRADGILGSSFDAYHRQPAHQRNLLGGLRGTHRTEMVIGGRHFSLVATPIVNDGGERLGTAVEWQDRTAEVRMEREVADIIGAAAAGDFSRRLDTRQMSGFFGQLADRINGLLDANSRALEDVGTMLNRLAQGDLTRTIDTEYQGMLGRLKDDANGTVAQLKEIILAIKTATEAINTAAKEIASGNHDLSSRTEEQASSLEETASSMEEL
ncbi:MAG TPA: HAMP domain-containing protein, partial [Rhodocyclaceae bacterium]|nr:HAMP domain-containing protein [Rhodocyclaceae bacterium]